MPCQLYEEVIFQSIIEERCSKFIKTLVPHFGRNKSIKAYHFSGMDYTQSISRKCTVKCFPTSYLT